MVKWDDLAEPCKEPIPTGERAWPKIALLTLVIAAICFLIAYPVAPLK